MYVKILGAAAGGGFPQWNCACDNCARFRAGNFRGKARTQSQVAVSSDGRLWFLLNASPDLRVQIEATPELHPRRGLRDTPIAGVILTSAEVDHVAGLLHLREFQPFRIYATPSVREILTRDNSLFKMLERNTPQAVWTDIQPGCCFAPASAEGKVQELRCEPIRVAGDFPHYVSPERRAALPDDAAVLGLAINNTQGACMIYMPGMPQVKEFLPRFHDCDLLLADGTFWTDDELQRVGASSKTAREIGHLPISGKDGSLSQLAEVRRPRKMFVHINNTNPILDEGSEAHAAVRNAGWELAEDGWECRL
jgi:pyrroloquinoline quinone biosynthesis protein B